MKDDVISRQAAIDLLKQMRKDGDMIPWEGKDVFARIRKLPSAQQWILCSERLPEENGQYLITVKYKHVNDSYEDVYAEHGEWYDGGWDMFCFGHCGEVEDIIAWMPLPKPYEPKEDTE